MLQKDVKNLHGQNAPCLLAGKAFNNYKSNNDNRNKRQYVGCVWQCALPAVVVEELVERALSLLTCGYDPARKNVALLFGACIHFRGILDVFDRVGGLPRLLDSMRTVLLLLHAPAHGENRSEKQARFCRFTHACPVDHKHIHAVILCICMARVTTKWDVITVALCWEYRYIVLAYRG